MPFRNFNGNPQPRFIVHATTAPTADNLMPVGTIWVNTVGLTFFVCSQITFPVNQSVWTPIT